MSQTDARGDASQTGGSRRWRLPAGWPARFAVALAGLALLAGAFALGWASRPPPVQPSAVAYGNLRIGAINAHLAQVKPGYVFLAGDSYLELYAPEPLPCGREIVNGGVGGAKAGDYLRFLDLIRLQPPPAAILLSVGLNNLLKKADPGGQGARAEFRQAADALIRRLAESGARIVVVAIPPVTAETARHFDLPSIEAYTQILRDICTARGCTLRDVFAEARDGEFWRARPGLAPDGLHLADLRRYYRGVYAELCG